MLAPPPVTTLIMRKLHQSISFSVAPNEHVFLFVFLQEAGNRGLSVFAPIKTHARLRRRSLEMQNNGREMNMKALSSELQRGKTGPHQRFSARGARPSLATLNFASPVRTPAV